MLSMTDFIFKGAEHVLLTSDPETLHHRKRGSSRSFNCKTAPVETERLFHRFHLHLFAAESRADDSESVFKGCPGSSPLSESLRLGVRRG